MDGPESSLSSRYDFQDADVCDVANAKMFFIRDDDGGNRKGKFPNDILMRVSGAFSS